MADPYRLPRQRSGTTPQMHGRYPDYDVLSQASHWDGVTRDMVLDRVENVPPIRFFDAAQEPVARVLCDDLLAQDSEPRIPVVHYVDEKLHTGTQDGYQYFDMPDDREAWPLVLQGLEEEAVRRGAPSFPQASAGLRHEIIDDFANAKLHGGAWAGLNVSHAFSMVMRDALQAFYSHPWAWNEIGFGGPAYPRGYSRFGSPHLQAAEREPWEGQEAYDEDPVSHQTEQPPGA